jgi:hypothetical protein
MGFKVISTVSRSRRVTNLDLIQERDENFEKHSLISFVYYAMRYDLEKVMKIWTDKDNIANYRMNWDEIIKDVKKMKSGFALKRLFFSNLHIFSLNIPPVFMRRSFITARIGKLVLRGAGIELLKCLFEINDRDTNGGDVNEIKQKLLSMSSSIKESDFQIPKNIERAESYVTEIAVLKSKYLSLIR